MTLQHRPSGLHHPAKLPGLPVSTKPPPGVFPRPLLTHGEPLWVHGGKTLAKVCFSVRYSCHGSLMCRIGAGNHLPQPSYFGAGGDLHRAHTRSAGYNSPWPAQAPLDRSATYQTPLIRSNSSPSQKQHMSFFTDHDSWTRSASHGPDPLARRPRDWRPDYKSRTGLASFLPRRRSNSSSTHGASFPGNWAMNEVKFRLQSFRIMSSDSYTISSIMSTQSHL
jgi:hypothetical protein